MLKSGSSDNIRIYPAKRVCGDISVSPDKSISHRAAIFSSLADGETVIDNFLFAEDCVHTLEALEKLGVSVKKDSGGRIKINGSGMRGLKACSGDLYFGNSGTGMRLMSGVLADQQFGSRLTGDSSLMNRPMRRITVPLSRMGADISTGNGTLPPVVIGPSPGLNAISYTSPIASAQVKSAILIAGLYARGTTEVIEPFRSRDHTEKILEYLGVDVRVEGAKVSVPGTQGWQARDISVPGDFSSAAFFIAAAVLLPGSRLTLKDVNLNPTRTGLLNILERMGAAVSFENRRTVCNEPMGDIVVAGGKSLRAVTVNDFEIARLLDEVPLIALLATAAGGTSRILGAGDLRKKESDRLAAISSQLLRMGQHVAEEEDTLIINGIPGSLTGASVSSGGDHRIAMMLTIAGLAASGSTEIEDIGCVNTSFPGFFGLLEDMVER